MTYPKFVGGYIPADRIGAYMMDHIDGALMEEVGAGKDTEAFKTRKASFMANLRIATDEFQRKAQR